MTHQYQLYKKLALKKEKKKKKIYIGGGRHGYEQDLRSNHV